MNMDGRRTARARGEQGQVTTALVIVVIVGLVTVGIFGVLGLARGVDQKSRAQSAADAAALAGAGTLSDQLPEILALVDTKGDLASLTGCALGQDRAEEYSQRNGATLTSYCFDLARDEVMAEVEMWEPVTSDVGPAVARAIASTGLDISQCSWADDEPPEPEESEEPSEDPTDEPSSPPPPPPPPPDLDTTLSCGPLTAIFTIGGETGLLRLVDVQLSGSLEPRLVD